MTIVTVYDADVLHGTDPNLTVSAVPLVGPHVLKCEAAIVWTEKTGGAGDEPNHLIINTKACQYVYLNPRLIYYGGRLVILTALSDREASGTVKPIKKYYIELDNTCSI